MCQPLFYAKFRWVKVAANYDASTIAPDSTAYNLKIDLEYPQHLYDRYTDLSFCPMRDKLPVDKFLVTLYDKQRYIYL